MSLSLEESIPGTLKCLVLGSVLGSMSTEEGSGQCPEFCVTEGIL